MNLFFRLLWISLFSKRRSAVPALGPCITPFRCWFTDLDILRHMNNGVYFSIMDLARVDLMIRAGLAEKISAAGWYPVAVSSTMRFRKSLKLFQKFVIESTIVGWDEKAFIVQQTFKVGDAVYAEAFMRARFLKKAGGTVTTRELLDLIGVKEAQPRLPEWLENWNSVQNQ